MNSQDKSQELKVDGEEFKSETRGYAHIFVFQFRFIQSYFSESPLLFVEVREESKIISFFHLPHNPLKLQCF